MAEQLLQQRSAGDGDRLDVVLAAAFGPAPARPVGDVVADKTLGDYRIIREIGRGGMGIVYEAEQISLGRRVALKVLPFAATLDPRQLQRFKNEAQAAAQLHHTHIVPVFGVGCERSTHFYAMQFIDGQSLATLIHQLQARPDGQPVADGASTENPPAPTLAALTTEHASNPAAFFRTIANWGIQAAEALEYAHQMGVIHRDIKPANLIVDLRDNLWITDFGLARLESALGQTMTGDFLGTLRYMSPEQAESKWGLLDHRTDVYSLGATLYELLTLQPVCAGGDRIEVLRQITSVEPRALRAVNSAIPNELEIIVSKALAKEPAARYTTAQELADDLRRYLKDEPIKARRPSLAQRLRKWMRRHKGVVTSAAIGAALLLVSAVVVLAVANARISREEARTKQALIEAKESQQAAEEQRERAEANFEKAVEAVDRLLTRVSEGKLNNPEFALIREKLLEDALEFFQGFVQQRSNDKKVRQETAQAYGRVGSINVALGHFDRAEHAFRQALALFDALRAEFPQQHSYRYSLAANSGYLAGMLRSLPGRLDDSQKYYRQTMTLWSGLAADFPKIATYRANLADATHWFGYLQYTADRLGEAEESYHQALAIFDQMAADFPAGRDDYHAQQGAILNSLGVLQRTTGRPHDAELTFRHAERTLEALPASKSDQLRRTRHHLTLLLAQNGHFEEAEKLLRPFLAGAEEQIKKSPHDPEGPAGVALGFRQLAGILFALGRPNDAEVYYHKALAMQEKLVADFPKSGNHRARLSMTQHVLGNLWRDTGRTKQAEQFYLLALEIQTKLVTQISDSADYQFDFARIQNDLGILLSGAGRSEEAQHAFKSARSAFERGLELAPQRQDIPTHLARFLATCPEQSFRDVGRAVALAAKAAEKTPQNWHCWRTLGIAQYRSGDCTQALAALQKCTELYAGGNSFDWFFLAMAQQRLGETQNARRWFDQAVAWMENNRPQDVELRRFRAEAAALLKTN